MSRAHRIRGKPSDRCSAPSTVRPWRRFQRAGCGATSLQPAAGWCSPAPRSASVSPALSRALNPLLQQGWRERGPIHFPILHKLRGIPFPDGRILVPPRAEQIAAHIPPGFVFGAKKPMGGLDVQTPVGASALGTAAEVPVPVVTATISAQTRRLSTTSRASTTGRPRPTRTGLGPASPRGGSQGSWGIATLQPCASRVGRRRVT